MDDYREAISALDDSADDLKQTLGSASVMVAAFDGELRRMREGLAATSRDVTTLERGFSKGLRRAFDGLVFGGDTLSRSLETLAKSMINTTYNAAMRPVTDHIGGAFASGVGKLVGGLLPFADGAPFSQGRVMPFATGGIVSQATPFGMRGGIGVMGEAGPEAIMPLARGPDGKLGVKAEASSGPTIVMHIQTPDAQSFMRSQSQIATQMSRALSRANRNR